MIPATDPFKKTYSLSGESTGQISEANEMDGQSSRNISQSSKVTPPPAPVRRASGKKGAGVGNTPSVTGQPAIQEEEQPPSMRYEGRTSMSDFDRKELDDLENDIDILATGDSSRPINTARTHRSSSSAAHAVLPEPARNELGEEARAMAIPHGAPQINGSTTPQPFGESLPTPEIVSRDLTRSSLDGGGRKSSISGGVTSAGLMDPQQRHLDVVNAKPRRRPSSTGPILCALGCGTMGRSILSGVLDALEEHGTRMDVNGLLPPARFTACVRREAAANTLKEEWGDMVSVVRGPDENAKAVSQSDYVLLGVKPQVAREILNGPGMQEALRGKVLISILAGTTIETLQNLCPASRIVRVMPNTPSRIRKGMSVIVSGQGVSQNQLDLVSWIFNQVGKTLIMDEKHIDAATAMCGSGPAFMAVILESMTDGGVMMGIPRAQAEELAAQTMLGTASMVQAGQHPALIRNAVATPGGCTIGGLLEMEDGKIRSTMARTIQTATNIAAGLGKN